MFSIWSGGNAATSRRTGSRLAKVSANWVANADSRAAVVGDVRVTTTPDTWVGGGADLLVWEAFVSGAGKPRPGPGGQHAADAAVAARTFAARYQQDQLHRSDVVCAPHTAVNLVWATARGAGLTMADAEAAEAPAVYLTLPGS